MSRVNEFNACPFCGDRYWLDLLDKQTYYELFIYPKSNSFFGKSGFVSIECGHCGLELRERSRRQKDGTLNYDILCGRLKERWNSLVTES